MFVELSEATASTWHEWGFVLFTLGVWALCGWHLIVKQWRRDRHFITFMAYTALYGGLFITSGRSGDPGVIAYLFLAAFAIASFLILGPPKKH